MKHIAQKLTFLFLLWAVAFTTDTRAQTKKGRFQAEVEAGWLYSGKEGEPGAYSISGKFGYLLNDVLFLGGGIGMEYIEYGFLGGDFEAFRIPVFISPKYSFNISNRVALLAEIDAGVRIYTETGKADGDDFFVTPKLGFGVKVDKARKHSVNLYAGYNHYDTFDMFGIFAGFSF